MRLSAARSLGLLAALALPAGGACGKRRGGEEPADRVAQAPRITPAEADRGRKACESYVDQVCDCALAQPELTAECDMARARPSALDMSLRAAMAEGNATERDRVAIQANAQQIARACIEDSAALIKRGCGSPEGRSAAPGATSGRRAPVPAPPAEPEPLRDQTR